MRSNEERAAAVKRRVRQLEMQRRRRRNLALALSSAAACLAIIAAVSLAMPGMAGRLAVGDYSGYETAASIFGGSAAVGYIAVGLLAFALGVFVTVLCFRLKVFDRRNGEDGDGRDN